MTEPICLTAEFDRDGNIVKDIDPETRRVVAARAWGLIWEHYRNDAREKAGL